MHTATFFRVPMTGLRFLTVYGPWGRPDLAMFSFARSIVAGAVVNLSNYGRMQRGLHLYRRALWRKGPCVSSLNPPSPIPPGRQKHQTPATSNAPYRIYNIGNNAPVDVREVLHLIEKIRANGEGRVAPIQPGDAASWADIDSLVTCYRILPSWTLIETGIASFIDWFKAYHRI